VIGLSGAHANSIKAAGALVAVSTADASVTLSKKTTSDMDGAAVVSIDDTAARQVDVFVADNIAPSLSQFDLDMAQLVLRFSETVRASTLSVTQLSLQSNTTLGGGSSFTLTSSSTASTADSATVTVSLSASDANAIKALLVCCARGVATPSWLHLEPRCRTCRATG